MIIIKELYITTLYIIIVKAKKNIFVIIMI